MATKSRRIPRCGGNRHSLLVALPLESAITERNLRFSFPRSPFPFLVPNVTTKILSKIIEYCKKHVKVAADKIPNDRFNDDELKAWDADLHQQPRPPSYNSLDLFHPLDPSHPLLTTISLSRPYENPHRNPNPLPRLAFPHLILHRNPKEQTPSILSVSSTASKAWSTPSPPSDGNKLELATESLDENANKEQSEMVFQMTEIDDMQAPRDLSLAQLLSRFGMLHSKKRKFTSERLVLAFVGASCMMFAWQPMKCVLELIIS
ncbi:uncharacterized protein LOC131228063 [Magnolia sinica]|uniref:uncharacterized protein LOC131228063 n=1 Tax=Magnolia sinica TaxID=86752 RepID=UPI00265B346A|nr:uncharacterized protein LOC131228063 [Magnolia sinica]